jgi:hypothetical protein
VKNKKTDRLVAENDFRCSLPFFRSRILELVREKGYLPSHSVNAIHICFTWSDNKVRELIAVKVLHTSLLNITAVAFKILPLGSYAPMPAPSPPFETILKLVLWNSL